MLLARISDEVRPLNDKNRIGRRRRSRLLLRLSPVIVGVIAIFLALPTPTLAYQDFLFQIFGPRIARPGDTITFSLQYQNLGWPSLTDIVIGGRILEHTSFVSASPGCYVFDNILVCLVGALEQGEGGQVELTLHVDEDAPANLLVQSKLLAIGREPCGTLMILGRAWLSIKIVVPALEIAKQPSASVIYVGDQVTYTYTLTNTSFAYLEDVTIVDDHKTPPQVCGPVYYKLWPGDTLTCTWTTTLYADTINTATGTGVDPWGDPVTDTASAHVNTVEPPGEGVIVLEKAASAEVVYVGDTLVYTYTVANLGDHPLHDISLTDDHLGVIATSFELAAGEGEVFTATTDLTADTTNVATAVGYNLLGDLATDTASAHVNTVKPPGEGIIALEKAASAEIVYVGDTVVYT